MGRDGIVVKRAATVLRRLVAFGERGSTWLNTDLIEISASGPKRTPLRAPRGPSTSVYTVCHRCPHYSPTTRVCPILQPVRPCVGGRDIKSSSAYQVCSVCPGSPRRVPVQIHCKSRLKITEIPLCIANPDKVGNSSPGGSAKRSAHGPDHFVCVMHLAPSNHHTLDDSTVTKRNET